MRWQLGPGKVRQGSDALSGTLFSDVDLEERIRSDHPPRVIRGIANAALASLSADYDALYAACGHHSPEWLQAAANALSRPST